LGLQKYFIFVIHQILKEFFCKFSVFSLMKNIFENRVAKKMMFFESASQKSIKLADG